MKLIRHIDGSGAKAYARLHENGSYTKIEGCPFGEYKDSGESVAPGKILAPVEPRDILCIGLNYRRHAEEGKQALPEHPVLFMKNSGAVQNPGDPIVLPGTLKSDSVDSECELAVISGKNCQREGLAKKRRGRAMVSRQNLCHLLSLGTCAGHDR